MPQGQELKEKLYVIWDVMKRYEDDIAEYGETRRMLKEKKRYIETEGAKGKANMAFASVIIVFSIFFLIVGLLGRNFSNIGCIIVLLLIYFTCKISHPKVAKVALGFLVFCFLSELLNLIQSFFTGNWLGLVLLIIAIPFAILAVKKGVKVNRSYVDDYNEDVQKYNASYMKRMQELYEDSRQQDSYLRELTQGWFPQAYLSLNVVGTFIDYMEKNRADTMKELANLYEMEEMSKKQLALTTAGFEALIESNRNINEQLRFSNLIGLYNIIQIDDIRKHWWK